MKPLHAKLVINLYNEIVLEKGKGIALNGWKAPRILVVVEIRSVILKCLDPFNEIDPVLGGSLSFEGGFQFPKEGNADVYERY